MDDVIYRTKREKYNAVIEEIQKNQKAGQATLVGTTSVEVSEVLSKMLRRKGVKHNVLNAKQHEREADIVSEAGHKGSVTIATNMAGRGTDIKLHPDVKEAGGLCIIGTERHESRRIDRQLRGRSGRQGDPGETRFYLSLDDDLLRLFKGERIAGIMEKLSIPEGEPIEHSIVTKSVERAQKKVEQNNFGIRKRLLEYDNVMNQQREVIYDRRRHALRGERLKGEIFEYIHEFAEDLHTMYQPNGEVEEMRNELRTVVLSDLNISSDEFKSMKQKEFVDKVMAVAEEFYERKEEKIGTDFMSKLERVAVLQTIDEKWRDHLRSMDELKEGIHLRSYGQKDPLLEYKKEAYEIFVDLVKEVNKGSVQFAFQYFPQVVERQVPIPPAAQQENQEAMKRVTQTVAANVANQYAGADVDYNPDVPQTTNQGGKAAKRKGHTIVNSAPRVKRNDPCPCGSGKKYKQCHGRAGSAPL
jgi:preprotein translocase subunit SecA